MRLHEDRYWEVLLQYKPGGPGKKSLVDDPKFFFAPDGKTNPEAELAATLAAFFQTDSDAQEHPRCRFASRYAWLKERLLIDETRLPAVRCTHLEETLAHMNPKSAALVFPAAHNNSPASMFGHTLIRIDSGMRSDLLSHAATYAAMTADTSNFLYAFKGIFGYYRGYYSNLPYYEKVAEYNDIERRDIWEYELSLTEEEVLRMVLSIWELKDIYSDYYFFDENCSYNLLFLLEAARPSLRLTDAVGRGAKFWVIPADTIRAVKDSGMVTAVRYRPSKVTRILFMASRMDDDLQDTTLDVVAGRTSPQAVLDLDRDSAGKKKALDLAAEVLQYRFSRGEIEKDVYLKRFFDVLKVRSTLGTGDSDAAAIPAPEDGHLPGKAGVGAGYRGRSWFSEVSWRAAYHDLMDPDAGYIAGSQINFMDVRGRYYFDDDALRLHSLRVIDIVSLAGRSKFYKPVSWKVNTGLEQKLLADGREHLIYRLDFGRGMAVQSDRFGLAYLLAEADLNYSGAFEDRYAAGVGASAGVLMTISEVWKLHFAARMIFYALGDNHQNARLSLEQTFRITTNNSLRLSLFREKTFHHHQSEYQLSWNFYF